MPSSDLPSFFQDAVDSNPTPSEQWGSSEAVSNRFFPSSTPQQADVLTDESFETLSKMSKLINPERFYEAQKNFPESTNIDDRRSRMNVMLEEIHGTLKDWFGKSRAKASEAEGVPPWFMQRKTTIEQRGRPTIELPPAPGGPGGNVSQFRRAANQNESPKEQLDRLDRTSTFKRDEEYLKSLQDRLKKSMGPEERVAKEQFTKELDKLYAERAVKESASTPENKLFEERLEILRKRLVENNSIPVPKDIAKVSQEYGHFGFDRAGQAISAIRADYREGGINLAKKRWDIQPKDELPFQKIINHIKATEPK